MTVALGPVLVPTNTDDGQDVQEDVDDVQVQVEGCEDVLLGGDAVLVLAAHHQLRVVHQVDGEQQSAEGSVHEGHHLAGADYHQDDTWNDSHIYQLLYNACTIQSEGT